MILDVLKRVLAAVPTVLIVAVLVFLLVNAGNGDAAAMQAGDAASPAEIELIRHNLGLDLPLPLRFLHWLASVATGDLGTSLSSGKPVLSLIAAHLEPTLSLALATSILATLIAVPLGIAAAWQSGRLVDRAVVAFSVVGFSIPSFVTAYFTLYVLALKLGWLPVQGFAGIGSGIGAFARHMALPCLVLCIPLVSLIARITRGAMGEVLAQDYIRTAAAKGLDSVTILRRHALRNAAPPIVTVVSTSFAFLMGGVVVTETVFNFPGLGRLTVDAITRRDYPVIQGVVLLLSVANIAINLAADLSYALLDPKIRP